ncbi:MAG: EpsD family peptidyl-prolyl cis-trans isomerase [Thiobacillus sp.]
MNIRHIPLITALMLFAALSACEQPPSAIKASIVAKVGGAAISEAELDNAVSRLGNLNEAATAQARSNVLEALIDQNLVSNAARNAKLDKAPGVILAMQQAQRQVLVEAYMERLFKDLAQPSDTEIQDYFTRHPELFSARKIYRMQELQLQMATKRQFEVEAQLKRSHNLAGFADWLKAQGIKGITGEVVKPAEQIPAAILAQIKDMKDGQVTVLATEPERIVVLQLQGSQTQPVTLEQAKESIGRVLMTEKRKTLLEAEIKKLRSSGKIEYVGGFVPKMPAAGTETTFEPTTRP